MTAQASSFCIDCGMPVSLPGNCSGCGRFWESLAALNAAYFELPVAEPTTIDVLRDDVVTAQPIATVPCLVIDGVAIEVPLHTELVLGRQSPWRQLNRLLASKDGVSRRHAAVTIDEVAVTVRDLDSLNGTWIDDLELGRPTTRPFPLEVRLGATAVIQFELLEPTEATQWSGEPS